MGEVARLEAEEPLDLVPAAEDERDGECQQHGHHDVEAVVRETALLPRPGAGLAARTVVAVAKLDRGRVDGGLVGGLGRGARIGQGRRHGQSLERAGAILPSGVVAELEHRPGNVSLEALTALVRASGVAAGRETLGAALADLAGAARIAGAADLALIRCSSANVLEAVALAGPAALVAELEGTQLPAAELPAEPTTHLASAPASVRHAAARAAAQALLLVPVRSAGRLASVELYRTGAPFREEEQLAAELAAGQVALVLRAFAPDEPAASLAHPALELAGEALGAGDTAADLARVAANVVGAPIALIWDYGESGFRLAGAFGIDTESDADLREARELAQAALDEPGPVRAVAAGQLPGGYAVSTALPLGQPPVGLLQLLFVAGEEPDPTQLARLTTFGVRAAQALRAGARSRLLELELDRTRALLAVVGQATSELSLTHTLETSVDRVAALLGIERVALYLRADDEGLVSAAGRGLAGPHERIAERLLEVALGPARSHAVVIVADASLDDRLHDLRDAVRASDVGAALAAPLLVRDEIVGLLAVYPEHGRLPAENEAAMLAALAGQLAVAVQNAQLHERATESGRQREAALASERDAARRLRALYEISRSFAQELSLEKTLEALATTVVDVLDVDAAVISMPDDRRDFLTPRAIHVRDAQLADAAHAILFRPEPFGAAAVQRLFRDAMPYRIQHGHTVLEPFLEKGWTAAVVPVATPAETIAALTIYSFRPGNPIGDDAVEAGLAIAGQAALAVDNARLYQQQKEFADTMQRSLLPREPPDVPGLDVGEVYESSARVDVGGDIYDFLELDDGRLAVVLGDVTGHGVEATADMAMAKFVFRSLAREHPEPGDFLAYANDVVVDEIAPGKFITMAYLAVDPAKGEVACASAGHPPPRLVLADGSVHGLEASGLVLGIDADQTYDEVRADFPVGSTIVLYTDGVVESRRRGELYGTDRLDALLAAQRGLAPRELANAVTEDARQYSGGELSDDLAVVVIRRTA
jgi:serine phosphatase RsbU (regulator of sigma subunit)